MRRIILATLAVAAAATGATAADAQYYRGGPAYRGAGICQREASRAWNRREADRIYRRCVKDMRRAERHRYRGW